MSNCIHGTIEIHFGICSVHYKIQHYEQDTSRNEVAIRRFQEQVEQSPVAQVHAALGGQGLWRDNYNWINAVTDRDTGRKTYWGMITHSKF